MFIIYTTHVLDQVKSRRWLVWNKAELYLKEKLKYLLEHGEEKFWHSWAKILTHEWIKIIYKKISNLEYKLITYAEHKEVDHIEYWLMKYLKCK